MCYRLFPLMRYITAFVSVSIVFASSTETLVFQNNIPNAEMLKKSNVSASVEASVVTTRSTSKRTFSWRNVAGTAVVVSALGLLCAMLNRNVADQTMAVTHEIMTNLPDVNPGELFVVTLRRDFTTLLSGLGVDMGVPVWPVSDANASLVKSFIGRVESLLRDVFDRKESSQIVHEIDSVVSDALSKKAISVADKESVAAAIHDRAKFLSNLRQKIDHQFRRGNKWLEALKYWKPVRVARPFETASSKFFRCLQNRECSPLILPPTENASFIDQFKLQAEKLQRKIDEVVATNLLTFAQISKIQAKYDEDFSHTWESFLYQTKQIDQTYLLLQWLNRNTRFL